MIRSPKIKSIEQTIGNAIDEIDPIVTNEKELIAALDAISIMTGMFIAQHTDGASEEHDSMLVDAFSERVAFGIKARRGQLD